MADQAAPNVASGRFGVRELIEEAQREAKLQLQCDGHQVEATAVQRLLVSRASSKALNKVLHTDLARLRRPAARSLAVGSPSERDDRKDAGDME